MRFVLLLFLSLTVSIHGQRTDFENIDFNKADSVAALYKGESLKNLPVLTHKLTASLSTDVEKFRAIYTWVSTNIENDYDSYLRTSKKRKKLLDDREAYLTWNNSFTPKVFENLIKYRKTACTGYAYLVREMATLAGFNCQIINGYGRTPNLLLNAKSQPNHSWNKIELNGKWYLCDTTWSAGRVMLENDGPTFQQNYHDGYFLAEPALFAKNHYPLEITATLLENPLSFDEFIEGPIVYKDAFTHQINPVSPKKMHLEVTKNEIVDLVLEIPKNIQPENLFLVLNNGGNDKIVQPNIIDQQNNIVLRHGFMKKGLYDVHIKKGDELIATYVVRVKR